MELVKWNPWREFEDLFDRYNKAMGWPRSSGQESVAAADWTPRVDVVELDNCYEIRAELPGIDRNDVRVTVDGGLLLISGERRRESEEKGKRFHRIERFTGSFSRSFTLPDDVEDDSVQASFKDGLLTITLQKSEKTRPKAVEVHVE